MEIRHCTSMVSLPSLCAEGLVSCAMTICLSWPFSGESWVTALKTLRGPRGHLAGGGCLASSSAAWCFLFLSTAAEGWALRCCGGSSSSATAGRAMMVEE